MFTMPRPLAASLALVLLAGSAAFGGAQTRNNSGQLPVRIAQLRTQDASFNRYAYALPSLLQHIDQNTSLRVIPEPEILLDFEDERLFLFPFIYANFADRDDWSFSALEQQNLRDYLDRGGFLFIDAGVTSEFLRGDVNYGQQHSFAEWDANPELKNAFRNIYGDKAFRPLSRAHPLFRIFYSGLPPTDNLPENVRPYVEKEKWPDGTYSLVGLEVNGRIAVLTSPIIAMGWGRNQAGNWITNIRFRVRETAPGISAALENAAYSGARFEAVREDGGIDVIYCQQQALPAWVQEPDNRWRVFRYYGSREINDFAHLFYTQLGSNILVYALTH